MCKRARVHVALMLRVELTQLLQVLLLLLLLQELQLLLIQCRVLGVGPELLVRVVHVLRWKVLASIGHEILPWTGNVCGLLHE